MEHSARRREGYESHMPEKLMEKEEADLLCNHSREKRKML